jgi:hypothetical protein
MATPWPRIHGGSSAGANWIEVDVADQFQQIGVGVDEKCLVSSLKDVAGSVLGVIDPLGVSEGDVLHDA